MKKRGRELPVQNLERATFRCVFPVCGGVCCKNGRPPITPAEDARIAKNIARFLPHLRAKARAYLQRRGWLTKRKKEGLPTLGVVDGWCVFHNDGCVLHKVGAELGDKWRFKPWHCIVFPLTKEKDRSWHMRQWGYRKEAWDLFCLNPKEDPTPARESLAEEIAFVSEFEHGDERWRKPS